MYTNVCVCSPVWGICVCVCIEARSRHHFTAEAESLTEPQAQPCPKDPPTTTAQVGG